MFAAIFQNPFKEAPRDTLYSIPIVIANIIQNILALVAILAVIFIIISGIKYIISSGDPGRIADAKEGIINAVIGVVLSASAFMIIEFLTRQF